jgi:hypothetical protein
VGRIKLSTAGRHNVYNCLAAVAIASCATGGLWSRPRPRASRCSTTTPIIRRK